MNALTTFPVTSDLLPAEASPALAEMTAFPRDRQAAFLSALAECGQARRAAKVAGCSHQTVYRARRACAAFRRGWDAALLAARTYAEDVLATRALDGVEEAVFYRGELIATRRRYDTRLLLAHLARLDRLAERADIAAALGSLDAQIDALRRGEEWVEPAPETPADTLYQDSGPCGPSGRKAERPSAAAPAPDPEDEEAEDEVGEYEGGDNEGADYDDADYEDGDWFADDRTQAALARDGSWKRRIPPAAYPEWEEDMDDPAHWVDGEYIPPLGRALRAMDAARAPGASLPHQLGDGDEVETLQLAAFEAGVARWWRVTCEDELDTALAALERPG